VPLDQVSLLDAPAQEESPAPYSCETDAYPAASKLEETEAYPVIDTESFIDNNESSLSSMVLVWMVERLFIE